MIEEACREVIRRDRLRSRDLVVLIDAQVEQRQNIECSISKGSSSSASFTSSNTSGRLFGASLRKEHEKRRARSRTRWSRFSAAKRQPLPSGLRIKAGRARLDDEKQKTIETVVVPISIIRSMPATSAAGRLLAATTLPCSPNCTCLSTSLVHGISTN